MMDSQDSLQQPQVAASEKKLYTSKEEVLARVKAMAHDNQEPQKSEIEYLKATFYQLLNTEREAAQKAYLDAGGDPLQYIVPADPVEEEFKNAMGVIKELRQKAFEALEAEKQRNLTRKREIIDRIRELTTTPDEAQEAFQEVKQLQAEWKDVKPVPAENASELWNSYKLVQEQFYDLLKMNFEAREYDFKKNYEAKAALCEAAEKLGEAEDVIAAFHQLQDLHDQYREIGPVAKEQRNEIWGRFKQASTIVNRRHAAHFEAIKAEHDANLEKKSELCDKIEMIVTGDLKTPSEWENKTKEVIALQAEWKTIGFAPKAMNIKIFERFRTACDQFFAAKNDFFDELKGVYQKNLDKKRELIEQAKQLKDSTDWKETADKFVQLQKDWKAVGMVPKKVGDQLWEEFIGLCNEFFDARKAAGQGARQEQVDNMNKKQSVIEQIKAAAEEGADNLRDRLKQLSEEYNAIGHVPFKDKDKVYDAYREALDAAYDKLRAMRPGRKSAGGSAKSEGGNDGARQRLQRLQQELANYETNLNFLSATSKKGNSLIDEMNRKVERLRNEIKQLKEDIKASK